jgi:hypothetical protein
MACKGVHPALLPVDYAEGVVDLGAKFAKMTSRKDDLSSGSNHVLYDEHPPACQTRAFAEPGGAIRLRVFSDKSGGQACVLRKHGHDRDAAQLELSQNLGFRRDEWNHLLRDLQQELRVGFEPVLVEVLGGCAAGAQDEVPSEMATGVNPLG